MRAAIAFARRLNRRAVDFMHVDNRRLFVMRVNFRLRRRVDRMVGNNRRLITRRRVVWRRIVVWRIRLRRVLALGLRRYTGHFGVLAPSQNDRAE